jgi:hypothetical protein
MSFNLTLFVVLVLLAVYMVFIEIFTIVFMMTGLSHTRSVFQVISLLTNSGFTTNESEIIVTSRKRRKIAIFIMSFGNFFNILLFSALVNAAVNFYKDSSFNELQAVIIIVSFIILVVSYKKLPFIRVGFDRLIKKVANRMMFDVNSNPLLILDSFHNYCIAEVKLLEVPELLKNTTIFESKISNSYGIHILLIKRGEEHIGEIKEGSRVMIMDRIIIFGPLKSIMEVFDVKPLTGPRHRI